MDWQLLIRNNNLPAYSLCLYEPYNEQIHGYLEDKSEYYSPELFADFYVEPMELYRRNYSLEVILRELERNAYIQNHRYYINNLCLDIPIKPSIVKIYESEYGYLAAIDKTVWLKIFQRVIRKRYSLTDS